MLFRTQAQIREAVQRTADVLNFTDKHPVDYVNDLINRGLGRLSTICRTTNPEFQPIAQTTIATDGSATIYPLPIGFHSLISVEYTGDNTGLKRWLDPYEMIERPLLSSPDVAAVATSARHYRVLGTNIEFLPKPAANHKALLWYATNVTQLTGDASNVDTMDRLDSYVIWWAAREIASERENWERVDRLTGQLGDLEADVRVLARLVDLNGAARPRRTKMYDRFGRRCR